MTIDTKLSGKLVQDALDLSDHPFHAVSALMSAAATILGRMCGEEQALDLMTQALDTTGALLRSGKLQ